MQLFIMLPEGRRGVSSRVSVLIDESTCAAQGEFLSDVQDGVRQTFLQSVLILHFIRLAPAEHLIVVNSLIVLYDRVP